MSVKYDVLKRLEAGVTVSGAQLALELQVSRNAVWKAVGSLRQDGYSIEGQTNTGYTLLMDGDVLSVQSVEKELKMPELKVHVYESVSSTNTALKEWAMKGYPEGTVLIAQQQTGGKGRLGRSFASPEKTGLYMSILLRPKFLAEQALSITTAAAVAVAEAVESLCGRETKIKWVNDVFLNGLKICGILTEASMNFENGGLEYAVLGIGVNIKEPEGGFVKELQGIVGTVFGATPPPQARSKMAAEVLRRFFTIYSKLPDKSYIDSYRRRSLLTGRRVRLMVGNAREAGIVEGLNDELSLLVRLDDGSLKAYSSGEANIEKEPK